MSDTKPPPDVSVCMVSLNSWAVLEPCLRSLEQSDGRVSFEVIIVDNGSADGSQESIKDVFPSVRLIELGRNVGFTKATNRAIEASSGRFLLWLNTDTILLPNSISELVLFLEARPECGIVGPMVLNADGSFQPQCRRGVPTPLAAAAYMLRLDRLRPKSRALGQYLLTFLPIDIACRVDAVSGCCLLARREVWDAIGPLDEDIFGFGEDVDWCVRATGGGWQVWYNPDSVLTHLKGQGGAHSKPYHKVWGIHRAMWIFYRKHLRARYSFAVTPMVATGIVLSATMGFSRVLINQAIPGLNARTSVGKKSFRANEASAPSA